MAACWAVSGRSIPACAGEPPRRLLGMRICEVYPRVCGGTRKTAAAPIAPAGLSPRVRGNPLVRRRSPAFRRSIPACAGEPPAFRIRWTPFPVYPRVCGGTSVRKLTVSVFRGLSPRVRGNHDEYIEFNLQLRSIPACAGEPPAVPALPQQARVYPRVCGGTRSRHWPTPIPAGLSPRVRGNPGTAASGAPDARSIPACAGEPSSSSIRNRRRQVYPRVCGGTTPSCRWTSRSRGLSPRVRGNRRRRPPPDAGRGSIPACAGEPAVMLMVAVVISVYPRVCGGTPGVA